MAGVVAVVSLEDGESLGGGGAGVVGALGGLDCGRDLCGRAANATRAFALGVRAGRVESCSGRGNSKGQGGDSGKVCLHFEQRIV